jgi:hypothetical protein
MSGKMHLNKRITYIRMLLQYNHPVKKYSRLTNKNI